MLKTLFVVIIIIILSETAITSQKNALFSLSNMIFLSSMNTEIEPSKILLLRTFFSNTTTINPLIIKTPMLI